MSKFSKLTIADLVNNAIKVKKSDTGFAALTEQQPEALNIQGNVQTVIKEDLPNTGFAALTEQQREALKIHGNIQVSRSLKNWQFRQDAKKGLERKAMANMRQKRLYDNKSNAEFTVPMPSNVSALPVIYPNGMIYPTDPAPFISANNLLFYWVDSGYIAQSAICPICKFPRDSLECYGEDMMHVDYLPYTNGKYDPVLDAICKEIDDEDNI